MEFKTIEGIILATTTEKVWDLSYLKVLTKYTLESLKVSSGSRLERSILKNSGPQDIWRIEAVKTHKNWIVKTITHLGCWCKPREFQDFLALAKINEALKEAVKQEEQSNLLPFLINWSKTNEISKFNWEKFQQKLAEASGY